MIPTLLSLLLACTGAMTEPAGPEPRPAPSPKNAKGKRREAPAPPPAPASGDWPDDLPPATASERAPGVYPMFVPPFRGKEYIVNGTFDHSHPDTDRHRMLTGWGTLTYGRGGHHGHDVVMKKGTPLYAMGDGVVVLAGEQGPTKCNGKVKDSDIRLRVRHPTAPDGHDYESVFLHLSEVMVEEGDRVTAGQLVARSGNTGCSSGAHLHFGVLRLTEEESGNRKKKDKDGWAVDPWGWWSPDDDPWSARIGPSPYLWKERPPTRRELKADKSTDGATGLRFKSMVNAGWRDNALPNSEELVLSLPKSKRGGETTQLEGYTLSNKAGVTYTFGKRKLAPGDELVLFSGKGTDTDTELYLGQQAGIWDDALDCATLRDKAGKVVDQFPWGRKDELPCGQGAQ